MRIFDVLLSDESDQRPRAGRYRAELAIPPVLNVGDYSVGVWVGTQHEDLVHLPVAAQFAIHGSDPHRSERLLVWRLPLVIHPRDPAA